MTKLEINNIKVNYDNKTVLEDVSVMATDGDFVTILGESGSGKSTLLKAICGIVPITQGEILINGQRLKKFSKEIAYMPQEDLLFPWCNIMENVCLAGRIEGKYTLAEKRAEELFEEFGLAGYEKAYPAQLSGGMRQRAALLRTALTNADIWMLDEPFASLDVITRGELQDWLIKLRHKIKKTVLLVTHDVEEAMYLSDTIYVLRKDSGGLCKKFVVKEKNRDRDWLYEQGELKKEIFHAIKGLDCDL